MVATFGGAKDAVLSFVGETNILGTSDRWVQHINHLVDDKVAVNFRVLPPIVRLSPPANTVVVMGFLEPCLATHARVSRYSRHVT